MKAQSAIEYLVTYGWMLISVSVIATTVFSVVDIGGCTETVSGFSSSSVGVENFGMNSNEDLAFQIRNSDATGIELKEIEVSKDDQNSIEYTDINITPGSSVQASLSAIEMTEECNTFDVKFLYDKGVLEDVTTSGTITLQASLIEINPPSDPEGATVSLT